jgi:hypothetical protein
VKILAALFVLACNDSAPPCGPLVPPDAACGQTFDVDYDPSTQNGCVFNGGTGTPDTCASICGATASCELVTFTTIECTTTCH